MREAHIGKCFQDSGIEEKLLRTFVYNNNEMSKGTLNS